MGKYRNFFLFLLFNSFLFAKDISAKLEELIAKGKLDQAENLIYQTQAEGNFSPIIQIYLAKIYFLRKNMKPAYETLMGIETPEDSRTRIRLVQLLLEFGDSALSLKYKDMAINSYYKAYKISPDFPLGSRSKFIAQKLMEEDNYQEAKNFFEKYVSEGGDFEEIAQEYIKCLYLLSQWEEIIKNSSKIVKYKEDAELQFILGEAYLNLAKDYLKKEMYENALEMLDKFIQWGIPKIYLDDAYFLKGQILEDFGNTKEALECYYKVLTLAPPRSIYARKARERISVLENR
ncbi:MAG: hypothetical protein QMD82_07930 [bacterium]|nr:hypothetical protein [bacterium]